MTTERLLSRVEVAELLGVPAKTVARWASLGEGPAFFKVGRHTRYRDRDVERWLAERRQEPRPRR